MNREFKGIWIPADIWLSKTMTVGEKLVFSEIDSLDRLQFGCIASNAHFSELFGLSQSRVSEIISQLSQKGFIVVEQKRQGVRTVQRSIRVTHKHRTSSEIPQNPSDFFGNPVEGSSEIPQRTNTSFTNPKKNPCHQQAADPIDYDKIFDSYEKHLPMLPRPRIRTDARKRAIKSAMGLHKKMRNEEWWDEFFSAVAKSKFLTGQTGWKACGFDWLLNKTNLNKVIDGNYDNA